ncbi:hypothetical protein PRIPAC_93892 [Pristionchus pacificus]|uniref:Uncharacterized protein n=1 Tax=Pristionchus pacificus TaxID=54126 RepID=A0A2A6CE21_PRIPA|nr:hypothetical protein PRIPAC_93892 [Pristionchus pacificus]|eukprot:PDM76452.1 hypothetical protein PRIPAC_40056 [Pristionchus pacificus]
MKQDKNAEHPMNLDLSFTFTRTQQWRGSPLSMAYLLLSAFDGLNPIVSLAVMLLRETRNK